MIKIKTDLDIDNLVKTFKINYNKLVHREGKNNEPRKQNRKRT